jgi:hypothetical protein
MWVRSLVMALAATLGATALQAQGSMSSLRAGLFGGIGIPTDNVVVATTADGKVTLGLSAHTRCQSRSVSYATCDMPGPVTNDGARTFYALAGGNAVVGDGGVGSVATGAFARWNFALYVGGVGSDVEALWYQLSYDFNPAVGNAFSGSWRWYGLAGGTFQNLASWFFSTPGAYPNPKSLPNTIVVPPSDGPFDPNAVGEYAFRLEAFNGSDESQGFASMNVSVVPEPSTAILVATGLGLAALYRRHRKASAA